MERTTMKTMLSELQRASEYWQDRLEGVERLIYEEGHNSETILARRRRIIEHLNAIGAAMLRADEV
jgi:hypothetical protein